MCLVYLRFRKFSVAPESRRANILALWTDECRNACSVIDFCADINTFVSILHLIAADTIRQRKNPLVN